RLALEIEVFELRQQTVSQHLGGNAGAVGDKEDGMALGHNLQRGDASLPKWPDQRPPRSGGRVRATIASIPVPSRKAAAASRPDRSDFPPARDNPSPTRRGGQRRVRGGRTRSPARPWGST